MNFGPALAVCSCRCSSGFIVVTLHIFVARRDLSSHLLHGFRISDPLSSKNPEKPEEIP